MANREMMALTGSELEPDMASAEESSQENARSNRRRVAVAAGFGLAFLGLLAAFVAAGGSAALMGSKMDNLGVKTAVAATAGVQPLYTNGVPLGTSLYTPAECVYTIKNARNSFYLNVDGGKNINEANAQLWNNPTSTHSRWYVTRSRVGLGQGVVNLQFEKDRTFSLNLADGGRHNKTNVQIYDNPESSDSQWQFYKIGTSTNYLIKSTKGQFYVGSTGDAIGANVTVNSDPSGPQNQWHLELVAGTCAGPTIGPVPTGTSHVKPAECTYNIMNAAEDFVVNVEAGAKTEESNVQLYDNPEAKESKWTLKQTRMDNGIYTIQSVNAATQYLNVQGGGRAPEYETNVQIYDNPESLDSQWAFYLESASNKYLIRNLATQQFLSAGGETIESNLQVTASLDDFAATRWVLKSITCAPAANPTTVTTTTVTTTTLCGTTGAACTTGHTCDTVNNVCKCGSNAACATGLTCDTSGTNAICMCGAFAACATGETCDSSGAAPVCKCGTNAACAVGQTCGGNPATCTR